MAYQDTVKLANDQNEVINPATAEQLELMRSLLFLLRPLSVIGTATGRLQVDVNTITAGTVSVSSLPVLNVNNIGGLGGFELQYLSGRQAYAAAVLPKITF